MGSEPSSATSRRNSTCAKLPRACAALVLSSGLLGLSCSNAAAPSAREPRQTPRADAPLVAAEPGAWFDASGNLTVVGAGKRLRLVLSAPISACAPAFAKEGEPADVVLAASLPFHVLGDACRDAHPAILLPDESQTASPAELERSYHEVAHCASTDFGLIDGWIPKLVAASDPCPIALGLGWRMPTSEELLGLTVDDRKAVAGALFDPGEGNAFGGLLLYARAPGGDATLVTLSPNAAEQPPSLDEEKRARPFFGAAVRCVSDSTAARHGPPPVLPGAGQCLRAQRQARGLLTAQPRYQRAAEVQNLKLWLDRAERTPAHLRDAGQLQTLTELLATPTVERIAREAREERALTERYADLAESIDDPGVSAAERERRHAEFDSMRKRLSGQIVQNAEGAGADRTALAALLTRAELMLETTAQTKTKASKKPRIDYTPLLARLRALSGKTAP